LWASLDHPLDAPNWHGQIKGVAYTPSHLYSEADKDEHITEAMVRAYVTLHRIGYAHSVEAWLAGDLAGGLYGVSIGRMFFGESMFAWHPNASKVALVRLAERLHRVARHVRHRDVQRRDVDRDRHRLAVGRGGLLDVELAERTGDHEIIVIKHQRPRHAVVEQFERHRIDRRLLAFLGLGVAVEIADRHRPARQRFHLLAAGGGIGQSEKVFESSVEGGTGQIPLASG